MDAFLSYKHEDKPWAERLHAELEKLNLKVFIDTRDLVAAQGWEQQLDDAIDAARSMVVLWSSKARNLDYTDRERAWFDRPELKTPRLQTRPVVAILLDDAEPTGLQNQQFITDLKDAKAYPNGLDGVPEATWQRVATRVKLALASDVTVVNTLVIAATSDRLSANYMGMDRWKKMEDMFNKLKLGNDVTSRYGQTALDWRPHGSKTISEILGALESEISKELPVRLENVNDRFAHDDPDDLRDAARGLSHKLALIVVDTFSLHDFKSETLFKSLDDCHRSRSNAFAVFAPQASDDALLNEQLRTQAEKLYKSFFHPIPYSEDQPSIGLNLRNRRELERLVLLAISKQATRSQPRRRSNVVLGGSRN